MNIIKKVYVLASLLFAFGLMLAPAAALAQDATAPAPAATGSTANKAAVCEGVGLAGGSCDTTQSSSNVQNVIKQVVNIISIVVGVVSVIMIIIGGFRYIVSGGDANGINSAKNTILYAIIGLVIVALSQVIVQFVIGRVAPKPAQTQQQTTQNGGGN